MAVKLRYGGETYEVTEPGSGEILKAIHGGSSRGAVFTVSTPTSKLAILLGPGIPISVELEDEVDIMDTVA